MAVIAANSLGELLHLRRIEMIYGDGDPVSTKARHERGGVLDRFRPVVLRPLRTRRAARADHRRTGFAQRRGDASTRAARGSRDDGDAVAERPIGLN